MPPDIAPPSRFQADLITLSMVLVFAGSVVMAFVLTQQHPEAGYSLPGWLEAIMVAGLPLIFAYRATSPTQAGNVAAVAGEVAKLGDAMDLNHLDTIQQIDGLAPVFSASFTGEQPTVTWTPPAEPAPMLWADPEPPQQQPPPPPAPPAARPVAFVSHPSAPPLGS